MLRTGHVILLLSVLPFVAACAPLAAIFGYSGPAIQTAAQLDQVKLMADGASFVGTGKTVSDHVISTVTGSDCKMTNILERAPVCVSASTEPASDIDKN